MTRAIDLGAGGNPDPRADETVDLHHPSADHQFDLTQNWPLDTASATLLTAHHVIEHLPDTTHFFQEAARVLTDDGELEVTVPLGVDADSDPDHVHQWTYHTPLIAVGDFAEERYWDPSIPLTLTSRDLQLELLGPLHRLTPLYNRLSDRWPTWAVQNCDIGELTATYQREARNRC